MLLRWFTSYSPILQIIIPLLALASWIPYHYTIAYTPISTDESLINYFFPNASAIEAYPLLRTAIHFMLMLSGAIFILRIFIRFNLVTQRSYVISILYITISSLVLVNHYILISLLANLILLIIYFKLFAMYETNTPVKNVFEISIYLSLGTILNSSFIFILPPVIYGIYTVRNDLNIKSGIALLLGIFIPIYLVGSIWYLKNGNLNVFFNYFTRVFFEKQIIPAFSEVYIVSLIFIGIILLMGIFWLYKERSRKIGIRRYNNIQVIIILYHLSIFLIFDFVQWHTIIWAAIPISFILTNWYLTFRRKRILQISIIIILLLFLTNITHSFLS